MSVKLPKHLRDPEGSTISRPRRISNAVPPSPHGDRVSAGDEVQKNDLADAIKKLYISKDYSDFTLTCRGWRYRLHKAVVCSQSDVFAAMLRSSFKEGIENHVEILEEDPVVVHCMIRYLYGFDYNKDGQPDILPEPVKSEAEPEEPEEPKPKPVPVPVLKPEPNPESESDPEPVPVPVPKPEPEPIPKEPIPEPAPAPEPEPKKSPKTPPPPPPPPEEQIHGMLLHAQVYVIADYYALPGLKSLAAKNLAEERQTAWNAKDFIETANYVYDRALSKDYGLRKIIVTGFAKHRELMGEEQWKQTLRRNGNLMYDVARVLAISILPGGSRFGL